jgi:hypothetical protein
MATETLEAPVTDNEEVVTEETVQQKKNRLRNEAEREVLNNHRDELNAITEAKFVEQGLNYTRRLTESEKAKKKIDELLAEHPELREQYTSN